MPVSTLLSMAQRAASRNTAGIQDLSDIRYEVLAPILKAIKNPDQLRHLEAISPHIADKDAELWKAFIVRDIQQWQKKVKPPKNPRNWGKVYRKLLKDEERIKQEAEEELRSAMKGLDHKKAMSTTTLSDKLLADRSKPPKFIDGVPNRRINDNGHWTALPKERKPILKNARTGKEAIAAIKRSSAIMHQNRKAKPIPSAPRSSSSSHTTEQISGPGPMTPKQKREEAARRRAAALAAPSGMTPKRKRELEAAQRRDAAFAKRARVS